MGDVRRSWLNQGGTTELLKPPSLGVGMEAFVFLQTAENDRQLRSRLEHILDVPQRVRLRPCWTSVLSSLNRGEVKP